MTPFQWGLFCLAYTVYLLFGGSVFMLCERSQEIQNMQEIDILRRDVKDILFFLDWHLYRNDSANRALQRALTSAKIGVINRISRVCKAGNLIPNLNDVTGHGKSGLEHDQRSGNGQRSYEDDTINWSFYNSVFFAFTIITTIGYGHLTPSTNCGKFFVIVYALFGIPINTILLRQLADIFTWKLIKIHQKSKDESNRKSEIFKILFCLMPGTFAFIIIPSFAFVLIEKWRFLDAVYYTVVTLTTIGFGDYVAGNWSTSSSMWIMWVYQIIIVIWIILGLGFLLMILTFISKGMTHKKVLVVIEKRLDNIRTKKDKLTHDIDYMRRVVNELYFIKIKPIYEIVDDLLLDDHSNYKNSPSTWKKGRHSLRTLPLYLKERRRASLPNVHYKLGLLNGDRHHSKMNTVSDEQEIWGNVTQLGKRPRLISRRRSESDLCRINRCRTFESALRNQVTVDELFVSVVKALSGNAILDVMEAVERLNECENELLVEKHAEDEKDFRHTWNNDVEIGEKDELVKVLKENNLEHVAVSKSSHFIEKVNGAIRKISSESKNSTTKESYRKVSRNRDESPRKLPESDFLKRLRLTKESINFRPDGTTSNQFSFTDSDEQRKISRGSRKSNFSWTSALSNVSEERSFYSAAEDLSSYSSLCSSKMSLESNPRSKLALASTSLADFLQALDNVHCKLNNSREKGSDAVSSTPPILPDSRSVEDFKFTTTATSSEQFSSDWPHPQPNQMDISPVSRQIRLNGLRGSLEGGSTSAPRIRKISVYHRSQNQKNPLPVSKL